ncbi:MAG TPA: hypothetical protein PLA68_13090, partial [Panacibacter sp.]|nr:hypothetical protein [Panacibacter sp.]
IADNPATPQPTACQLHGSATEGAGQVEDYSVIVIPAAQINAYKHHEKIQRPFIAQAETL